ncbi:MAG TPA: imidazole glycerol phosphate synthase subunit HisH [Steroidobacteraceae bacterium]|nr:imidazole glycerol phosphate synthase subunit HisH [Steroidobacteraceae bacterium]
MKRRVVIIENGGANTASLRHALERLEVEPEVTRNEATILAASHVILPGVGAARDAMSRLHSHGLDELIPRLTQPLLGICLGMQLLYEASEEGCAHCLGAIPGAARRLAALPGRPVPHMGWNRLAPMVATPLLDGIEAGERAYFVHSYALPIGPETIAATDHGELFSAVVAHRNFFGTQFHPERSAHTGARILGNFLALT